MNLTFKKSLLALALAASAGAAQADVKDTIVEFSAVRGVLDTEVIANLDNPAAPGAVVPGFLGLPFQYGKEFVDAATTAQQFEPLVKRVMGAATLRSASASQQAPMTDVQGAADATEGRWLTFRPGTRVQADNYVWIYLATLGESTSNSVKEPANLSTVAPFALKANNQLVLVTAGGQQIARFAKAKTDSAGNYVAIQFQFETPYPAAVADPITDQTALSIAVAGSPNTAPEFVVDQVELKARSLTVPTNNTPVCYAPIKSGYATQSNTSELDQLTSANQQSTVCVTRQFDVRVKTGVDRIDVNQDRKYFVDNFSDADYQKGDFIRANRRNAKEGEITLKNTQVDFGFTPLATKYRYVIDAPQNAQTAIVPADSIYQAAAYSTVKGPAVTDYYPAQEAKATNLNTEFFTSYAATTVGGTHRPVTVAHNMQTLRTQGEFVRLAAKGEVVHTSGIKDPNQWVINDRDYTMQFDIVPAAEFASWNFQPISATLTDTANDSLRNNKIISWEGNGSNVYIPYMPYRAENMGQVINLKNWSDTQVGKVKAHIVLENGVALPEVTVGTLNANSILMASGPIRAAIDTHRAANNVDAATVTRAAITLYSGASLDKVEVFSAYNNGSSTAVVTNSSNKSDDKAAVKQSTHFNCTDTGAAGGNTSCHDENVEETPIP